MTELHLSDKFFVRPAGVRPDFRVVISFLWGDLQNCDTDGDSHNPASREWTELYCRNREAEDEEFDVSPVASSPLTLKVESLSSGLAARVAFFLATETNGQWADAQAGPYRAPHDLATGLGAGFDLAEAMQRARGSLWRKSSLENPYPNLARHWRFA